MIAWMKRRIRRIRNTVSETLLEEEIIAESNHKGIEHIILILRNISAFVALVLFLLSLIHIPYTGMYKAIGYFNGAAAYLFEYVLLTDCFTKKVPHKELFMVYCFGPLYILLGISYFQ